MPQLNPLIIFDACIFFFLVYKFMYFVFCKYFGPHLDVLARLKSKLLIKKNAHGQFFRVLNVRLYAYCAVKLEFTSRIFSTFLQHVPLKLPKILK